MDISIALRGKGTPNQNWVYFALKLKIFNTFFEKNVYLEAIFLRNSKMALEF